MALPTEADVAGAARDDVERYLQSATLSGPERVRLFRLAWDFAVSGFAGRQNLYEYYFFGDPVRMAGAYLKATDREPYKERVQRFLDRVSEPEPISA
jgi:4-hydroxyphenylacetate 3-monooxygenase